MICPVLLSIIIFLVGKLYPTRISRRVLALIVPGDPLKVIPEGSITSFPVPVYGVADQDQVILFITYFRSHSKNGLLNDPESIRVPPL